MFILSGRQYKVLGTIGMYHTIVNVEQSDVKVGDAADLPIKTIFVNPEIRREYR